MKILIACEYSGRVRDAFARRGHDAQSCDLLFSESPGIHYQGDVIGLLDAIKWDLVIAFPPCTHLAVSGSRYFAEKKKDGRQQNGIDFFMEFTRLDCAWAIENPVGIMSSKYRKPDQIIQPWQFGHPESKKTCLWLHNLPKLIPTRVLQTPVSGRWENQTPSGQNKLGPSPDRAKIRSKTYEGIAEAMAEQWGGAPKGKGSRETAYNKPQPKMAEQMNLLESATSGDPGKE